MCESTALYAFVKAYIVFVRLLVTLCKHCLNVSLESYICVQNKNKIIEIMANIQNQIKSIHDYSDSRKNPIDN